MSTLIITLPNTPASASTPVESVYSEDGLEATRIANAQLSLMPATGAQVVALVPAQQLSWHVVTLPRGTLEQGYFGDGGASRLHTVLEGLLEDRLLDEPASLHFALEPRPREGNPVRVATCNKIWLQAWIATLEAAGLPVTRIVPEISPTPQDAATPAWRVMGSPERPELLRSDAEGVTLLPFSAAAMALLAAHGAADASAPLLAEPGVAALAEQAFKRPATLQTRTQRALLAAQANWDLAQFDLLRTLGTRTRKHLTALTGSLLRAPQWRAARWASLALVILNLAGLQAWAWKEQSALTAKRVAIQNTLMSTFPDVRVVVDAPLQMARATADLQRQSGTASGADLEAMLSQFQAAAPDTPPPAAIEFIADELQLKGLDAAHPTLTDVATRLQARGYMARWDGDALVLRQGGRP
ncbi:MAG: general secretion pathway protein GspL [Burkholderiales bacterium]|nr:general secretion pathway protein GspL [Burkholderiales bacterium]